jgi:hypothetical protein
MAWDEIQRELISVVRDWPSSTLFTKESSMDLARLLVDGVSNMITQDRTTENDVVEARDSVRKVLEQMELERQSLGLAEFSETTLAEAKYNLLGRIWPFT